MKWRDYLARTAASLGDDCCEQAKDRRDELIAILKDIPAFPGSRSFMDLTIKAFRNSTTYRNDLRLALKVNLSSPGKQEFWEVLEPMSPQNEKRIKDAIQNILDDWQQCDEIARRGGHTGSHK